jgi:hypothetical protein
MLVCFGELPRSLDKAVSTLEMELAVERARSGGGGTAVATKPPQKARVVIGINTAFTSRKRRDSLRDTWVPRGSTHACPDHQHHAHPPPPGAHQACQPDARDDVTAAQGRS